MKTKKPQPLDLEGMENEIVEGIFDIIEDGLTYFYEQVGLSKLRDIPFNTFECSLFLEEYLKNKDKKQFLKRKISKLKQCLKSACEFYLRYKDKPELLIKEHSEYKKELSSNLLPIYKLSYWERLKYNEWLFKLTFKDVFKEK